jgi:hypothetical protein
MSSCFLLLALTQVEAGPLDAFQANYAAIQVDLDFVYRRGAAGADVVAKGLFWTGRAFALEEDRRQTILGRWSCDGQTEHAEFSSPEDVIAEEHARWDPKRMKQGEWLPYVPKTECIYDGETRAGRILPLDGAPAGSNQMISVFNDGGPPGFFRNGTSPFLWWGTYPFPQFLKVHFAGVNPTRHRAQYAGRVTEVERYIKSHENGWARIDVAYDPSVGYLPRFARLVSSVRGGPTAVKSFFLVEAQPCASGGFVPTEWYHADYFLRKRGSLRPDNPDERLFEPEGRVLLGHLQATRLRNRTGPVALKNLKDVEYLYTPGGTVRLGRGISSLTMASLKSHLGTRLTNPSLPPAPSLDRDELSEYAARPGAPWSPTVWIGLMILALGVAYTIWRRRRGVLMTLLLLELITSGSGCGHSSPEPIRLSASFSPSRLVYDSNADRVPLTLAVRNDGGPVVRVFAADGGCNCRRIDQSNFPTIIKPGEALVLKVEVQPNRAESPQAVVLRFDTDHGVAFQSKWHKPGSVGSNGLPSSQWQGPLA